MQNESKIIIRLWSGNMKRWEAARRAEEDEKKNEETGADATVRLAAISHCSLQAWTSIFNNVREKNYRPFRHQTREVTKKWAFT